MITSNEIADRPPTINRTRKLVFVLRLGFISPITLSKPMKMLATNPNHPEMGGDHHSH